MSVCMFIKVYVTICALCVTNIVILQEIFFCIIEIEKIMNEYENFYLFIVTGGLWTH